MWESFLNYFKINPQSPEYIIRIGAQSEVLMIIKSDKEALYIFVSILIASLFCFFVLLSYDVGVAFPLFVLIVMLIFSVRYWITTGRVFEMEEQGCTIRFLGFSKFYKWDEFTVKNYVDFTQMPINGTTNYGGVVFSPRRVRQPKWMQPVSYCMYVHLSPFSFVFVNFKTQRLYREKWTYVNPDIYVYDEDLFFEKLREWNVIISKE